MTTLYDLAEQIRRCTSCPLWKSRFMAVPGEGPAKAKLFFVGEAPGSEEDKIGAAFVGASGKFLDQLFKKVGIEREEVFLTNAVKCHPEKNRKPRAEELCTCRELWLSKQIETVNPKIIILLGQTAIDSLLEGRKVQELHGQLIKTHQHSFFVTYHPSAARRFPRIRRIMEEDFKKLDRLADL